MGRISSTPAIYVQAYPKPASYQVLAVCVEGAGPEIESGGQVLRWRAARTRLTTPRNPRRFATIGGGRKCVSDVFIDKKWSKTVCHALRGAQPFVVSCILFCVKAQSGTLLGTAFIKTGLRG